MFLLFSIILIFGTTGERISLSECQAIRANNSRLGIKQDVIHVTFGLYAGNVCLAHDDQWLDRMGITAVISLSMKWKTLPYEGGRMIQFHHYPSDDRINDNDALVISQMKEICRLIHSILHGDPTRKKENILLYNDRYIAINSDILRWYARYSNPWEGYFF